MILNEDYFDDIEITDDDLKHDMVHETADSHIPYMDDIDELGQYLSSKYRSIIMLTCYSKLEPELWNVTLPRILHKMDYLLDIYNIDYEYILAEDSAGHMLRKSVYDINGFTAAISQRKYEMLTSEPLYEPKDAFLILFYVNFPEFSYRQSYEFTYNLTKMMMNPSSPDNDDDYVYSVSIINNIPKQFLTQEHSMYCYVDLQEYCDNFYVVNKVIDGKVFLDLLPRALFCFRMRKDKQSKEIQDIVFSNIMHIVKMVESGINPFAKKS